ncbi:MAG: SAM-dependent methyltransferase [Clostridia bacterium]|nr:SAM-dependent methyltransferase [Clostridia bacterium]
MKLPPRLEYILSLTESSRHTVDVGSDHGKLAVAIALSGKAERVTASDVNAGPLSKAEALIEKLGVGDKVATRLADGLDGFEGDGVDQVIIAGMGGELIRDIIAAALWVKADGVLLILQPMTTAPELRRYLFEEGFRIEREGAVVEGRRPYEVITARYDGVVRECAPEDAEIGGFLDKDDSAVRALLLKKRTALKKRLIGAEKENSGDALTLKRVIAEIDRRLEE